MPDPVRKYSLVYGRLREGYRGSPPEIEWHQDMTRLAFEDRSVVERFALEALRLPGVVAVWIVEVDPRGLVIG